MHFMSIQGYDINEGRMGEFQAWLRDNEKELAQSMPEGVEYVGTFVAPFSSEKKAGSVFTVAKLDSYGAQDRLAAAGLGDGPFRELWTEAIGFMDQSRDANWSNFLLKSLTDATIIGDH